MRLRLLLHNTSRRILGRCQEPLRGVIALNRHWWSLVLGSMKSSQSGVLLLWRQVLSRERLLALLGEEILLMLLLLDQLQRGELLREVEASDVLLELRVCGRVHEPGELPVLHTRIPFKQPFPSPFLPQIFIFHYCLIFPTHTNLDWPNQSMQVLVPEWGFITGGVSLGHELLLHGQLVVDQPLHVRYFLHFREVVVVSLHHEVGVRQQVLRVVRRVCVSQESGLLWEFLY